MPSRLVAAICPGFSRSCLPTRWTRPLLALCLASPLLANAASPAAKPAGNHSDVRRAAPLVAHPLVRSPLAFEPNVGQAAPAAKYVAHGAGFAVEVEPQRTVLDFGGNHATGATVSPWRMTMQLAGARRGTNLEASGKLRGTSSYFPSSDVRTWHANVPTYGRVNYAGVYPGVDMAFYGRASRLEYDFTVASGSDPHAIHLRLGGLSGASIGRHGELLLQGNQHSATFLKPVAYQVLADGRTRRSVDVRYRLDKSAKRGTVDVAFNVGAYDATRPLIIDPVLTYGEYLPYGSNANYYVSGVKTDASGNAYVLTSYGGNYGGFTVIKVDPNGTVLNNISVGSGSTNTNALALAVDASGNMYVTGTVSTGLPTTAGAFQPADNGSSQDTFLSVLKADGSGLSYSTYFGGSNEDYGQAIAVDSSGDAYITGYTSSSDLPTTSGVYEPTDPRTSGYQTGFVAKFNPAVSGAASLVYSTYLSDTVVNSDQLDAIAVDASGDAFVTGNLDSGFPITSGAYAYSGGYPTQNMVYVIKLKPDASGLLYSAQIGPGTGNVIALDTNGSAYVAGYVAVDDFPTTAGAYQVMYPGPFALNLSADGSTLAYSTFLGGPSSANSNGATPATSIAIPPGCASNCAATVTGYTNTSDFPLVNAIQSTPNPGQNAFLVQLASGGASASFSTYLGGIQGNLYVQGGIGLTPAVAVDSSSNVLLAMNSNQQDFPITLPLPSQSQFAYLAKISPSTNASLSVLTPSTLNVGNTYVGSTVAASSPVTLRNLGSKPISLQPFTFSDSEFTETDNCGTTLAAAGQCSITVSITPNGAGTRSGTLTVSSDAPNSPVSMALTGYGYDGSYLQYSVGSLSFADQALNTTSAAQTFTIANVGDADATFNSPLYVSSSPAGEFAVATNCPGTLAPGATCSGGITFTPLQAGLQSGTLVGQPGAGSNLSVSGTGIAGGSSGSLSVSQAAVNFGTSPVGVPVNLPGSYIYVFNNSTVPVTISSITVAKSGAQDYSQDFVVTNTSSCLGNDDPQTTCYIYVTFTPSTTNSETATLNIANSTSTPVVSIALSGTGTAVAQTLAFSPSNQVFANQPLGVPSNQQLFYVYNTGNIAFPVDRVIASGDFKVTQQSCTGGVNQPSTNGSTACYIYVTFTPTAVGTRTGTVTVYDPASNNPQVLNLVGTGIAATGSLSLQNSPLIFAPQPTGTTSAYQIVTLTNTGNTPVQSNSIAFTGDFAAQYNYCTNVSIPPGSNCQVYVTFTPTQSSGTENGTLTIATAAGNFTATLQGTAEAATQAIGFTPTAVNFGNIQTGQTSNKLGYPAAVFVRNTGTEAVTFLASPQVTANFTVASNGCGGANSTLAPNSSCEIDLQFTAPASAGAVTGTLTLTDSAGTGTQSIPLSGTAVATAPNVLLEPTEDAFTQQPVGSNSGPNRYVLFRNNTAATINFSSVTTSGDFTIPPVYDSCLSSGAPTGSYCYVYVEFAPTAAGYRTGTLTFTDSNNNVYTVPLAGYAPAESNSAMLSPSSLAFADAVAGVPASDSTPDQPQYVQLQNNSNLPLTVGTLALSDSTDFSLQTPGYDNCSGTTVSAGNSCYINVAFAPAITGHKTGTITFPLTYTDSTTGTLTLTMSGNGVAPLEHATLAPTAISYFDQTVGVNYPTTGANPPANLTFTNDGNITLLVGQLALSDSTDFSVTGNYANDGCSNGTLAPKQTCNISVIFQPASAGSKTGTLTLPIHYSDSGSTPASFTATLSGKGVAPTNSLFLSPTTSQFPVEVVNTIDSSKAITFTVTNNSNAPAVLGTATLSAGFTQYSDQCSGVTLNVKATCSDYVEFAPTTATSYTGTLSIPVTGGATLTAALSGTGIPTSQQVVLSQPSVNFGNVNVTTSSPQLSASVVNQGPSGTGAVTITGVSLGGTNASDFSLSSGCSVGSALGGRSSCPLYVTFWPAAASTGARTATVTVTYGGGSLALVLTGTGTNPVAQATVFPTALAFGSQGVGTTGTAQTFAVTNSGSASLVVGTLSFNNATVFPVQSDGCTGKTVAPSSSCYVSIAFDPSASGTVSGSVSIPSNATTQTVSLSGTGTGGAAVTLTPGSLTFASQAVNSSSAAQSIVVKNTGGAILTSLSISVGGTNSGDFPETSNCGTTLAASASCTASITFDPQAVGSRSATLLVSDNATGSPQMATLSGTGAQQSQTITFNAPPSTTYGAAPITLNATASSGLPVSYAVTGPATISGSTLTITGAGTVKVTASQAGNANYAAATPVSQSFTVAPAPLTVTANNASRAYGAANPTFTYAITGFVNGDTTAVVGGTATLTTTATTTSPVGTYPITFATESLTASNYSFAYVAGTLTVSGGASQTITFNTLPNSTYGASAITLNATASSGLPVSYAVTGPATVSGSTLTITGAGTVSVTASQAGNSNYAAATPVTQSFTVAKAVLTATANNLSRQYGAANPTLTYAVTGFVNGDTNAVVSGTATLTTTATTTSPVGTYPITFATESLTASNYTFTYVAGTLTVSGGASQTITFNALPNTAYGAAAISLTATASSGLPVSYAVTGPATVSGSTLTITGAGAIAVTASQAGNSNYAAATPITQSFTVAKAVLTATANNLSRQYGAANPTLTYAVTGFVNGDTNAVVSGTATLTTTATTTSPVGTYPITFATESLTASNYSFAYVAGTLTVSGGASQTITFNTLPNSTYGASAITLNATASSGLPVSYAVTGPATVSGSTLTITGAGTVSVTASQAGNSNYAAATPVTQSFTVAKAVLTATANNLSRQYGAANPTLTYAVTGFVNGDTNAVVSGTATLTTTATSTSPVGTYPITFATESLTASNYTFTYVAGTLTVSGGASQTITFNALPNTTYGAAAITLTATASSGLPVSYAVTGPATVSGSTLTITGAGAIAVTASQAGNSNYAAATPITQSFTVAKATLTATANNLSRQYGAANPTLTYAVTGFVNGDTNAVVSGTATLTTTATTTSPVGTYPITFATESLTASNYTFTYVAGTLTVSGGASQTITFNTLPNSTYGASAITLNATASSGLPVSYAVTGPATISGSTLTITGAGAIAVTASQAGNSNYAAATPVTQSFTVAKAVLTATANNLSRQYGAANPTLTYAVTGFVNGDTNAVVSGTATLTTTATSTSPVGTYPITFATESLTASNYTFTYVAGTLTVSGGASQTITFNALPNTTYGAAAISLTATASSGLPVSYAVTGPATISGSTLTITGAGAIAVTASQAGNSNYAAATPVTQSFTVAKATLTVTAANVSVPYNQAIPALTGYTATGFVNGDINTVLSGTPAETTTATQGSPAGTYPISIAAGTLAATNYSFTFVAGTLTISGGASQTITFNALPNATYGAAAISLTATASSGLPVSYAVTGPATVSGSTLTITGAGTVAVTASQAGNSNYAAATPVSQSFTVAPASLTVTANNLSRQYGAANPTLTYAITGFVNGDTNAVVTGTATLTTTATTTSPVGTYPITFATESLTSSNYSFAYVAGTLTVSGGASQTITFNALPNTTYGAAGITLTATASSGLPVSYAVTGPATVSGSTLTITGAGTIAVTASQPGNSNYAAATPVTQQFAVAKAALTITATNVSVPYNQAIPALTGYNAVGFVDGDTTAVLGGAPSESTTATLGSPAGTYPITITQGTLAAANYAFAFVNGTLTITNSATPMSLVFSPSPITPTTVLSYSVTIGSPAAGQPNPAGTVTLYEVVAGGGSIQVDGPNAVGGGTGGVTTFTKSVGSGVPAGTYTGYAVFQPAAGSPYAAGQSPQVQLISQSKKSQTITFGALPNVTYGAAAFSLRATASSGLPVSYTAAGPATISGSTLSITGAGTVTVTASQAGNSIYAAATPVSQSFIVAQAPLTITALNVSVTYNQPIPALTGYTATGFVNGETAAILSGSPQETTTAVQGSPAGTYPITIGQGTLAAANYAFTFVNGTLTIRSSSTTVALTFAQNPITPNTAVTYTVTIGTPASGQPNPTGTITLYGVYPNGQTLQADGPNLVGTPGTGGVTTFTKTETVDVPVGTYNVFAVYQPASGSTYSPGTSPQVPLVSQ